jgi:hypothetical protein
VQAGRLGDGGEGEVADAAPVGCQAAGGVQQVLGAAQLGLR